MELQQLREFCAVADEGTISAAARRLSMTQPPLSLKMKQLEEEIGTPLFLRGARKVELTDAGRLLYERAQAILSLAENTGRELQDRTQGNTGTLRLGVVSSAVDVAVARWLSPFSGLHPGIHYEITESNTYHLIELLSDNLIDLAFVRTPFRPSVHLVSRPLTSEPILAAGAASFFTHRDRDAALPQTPAGKKLPSSPIRRNGRSLSGIDRMRETGGQIPDEFSIISPAALAGLPLICYRRWKDLLDQFFRREGISPDYFCLCDDARTAVSLARTGLGVAIVPASADTQGLVTKKISGPLAESEIVILFRKGGYQPTPVSLMLSFLQPFFSS